MDTEMEFSLVFKISQDCLHFSKLENPERVRAKNKQATTKNTSTEGPDLAVYQVLNILKDLAYLLKGIINLPCSELNNATSRMAQVSFAI